MKDCKLYDHVQDDFKNVSNVVTIYTILLCFNLNILECLLFEK